MSLIKKIQEYYKNKYEIPTLFTTPSHNQGNFIIPILKKMLGKNYFRMDFSEIDGFDNLRAPIDIIKKTQDKMAQIYDCQYTFMLTNGSTSGIIAAMQAILAAGDKVIVARNCHTSVYNGLVITGANPIWVYPEYNDKWGMYTQISPTNILQQIEVNPDVKAVIITSPTYEGIFSDINAISQICKTRNIPLIVDEAHGALLHFADLGCKPAIQLGADISVQSLHKTAGAPNPCAIMLISHNSTISKEKLQAALNLFNTTSPSYPLLLAMEGTVDYLNSEKGKQYICKLLKNIDILRSKLPVNIELYNINNDKTKILVKFDNQNNQQLAKILNEKFNIEEEFSTSKYMLFLTGIGTTSKKIKKLSKVLKKLCEYSFYNATEPNYCHSEKVETILTPFDAYKKDHIVIETKNAIGEICAEVIINYPPGIPLILPGEKITEKNIKFIKSNKVKIIK